MGKQGNGDAGRIRATTYEGKKINDDQVASLVLKVKPEDVESLILELNNAQETGATVFLSTFENESQFDSGGATYLSTTIGVIPTDDQPQQQSNNSKNFKGKRQASAQKRASMEKEVDSLVGKRSKRG